MASLEDMYNSGGGGGGGSKSSTNKTGKTSKKTATKYGGGENGLETYIIPPIKVRKGFRS
jgi:hypothetical protein